VDLTALTLLVLLGGLAAHALIAVLARAFYAGQDTRTPVIAAVAAVFVNVVVGAVTVGPFGLGGLAFAIAAGAWLEATLLLIVFRGRYPELDTAGIGRTFARSLGAAVVAGLLALGALAVIDGTLPIDGGKLALLGRAVIAGGVGAVGYLAMSLVLRVPELPALLGIVSDLVRRPRPA
jgi:putative peptidoglycan lipid II flippase